MHQKNTLTELLLSIFIPFYIFYWYAETSKVLRQRGATHVPSIKPLLWVTISCVASIVLLSFVPFLLIPVIMLGSVFGDGATIGIGVIALAVMIFLFGVAQFGLFIAMIVLHILYAINFSKAVSQVIHGMDQNTVALLCIFIAPVAVYMVQEKINQTSQQI